MEQIDLDGRVGLALPDGFHVMQEEERKNLRLIAEGEYKAFADPERHIISTVGWRDISFAAALLLSPSDAAQSAQRQIAHSMKDYGYALSGFLQKRICGKKTSGFIYTYKTGVTEMTGETYTLKNSKRIYFFNVYYRTFLSDESRKIWNDMLDSVSDLK